MDVMVAVAIVVVVVAVVILLERYRSKYRLAAGGVPGAGRGNAFSPADDGEREELNTRRLGGGIGGHRYLPRLRLSHRRL